ncbi:MAG TPA: hypothetical protein PLP48_02405, partial [Acholeplasmataceae bacterium]|nr:hypothetical protein [Acholeplasmataceae bacterium]
TLTLNAAEKVVTFDIVLGTPATNEAQVVTASYTGTTTTNMVVSVNNAASINLNPTLFNVLATNGDASALVGLNSTGQIRIYGNRTTGNGNTLSISIGAGYKITGVEFVFGASTNSPTATLTLGTSTQNLVTADLLNVTKTYSDLDITTFSLQNTQLNPSGSSNAQIYLLSIKITYIQV